jgi:hypothetical protein
MSLWTPSYTGRCRRREQQYGDYERPKVFFLAVPERVGLVSRFLAALVAQKKQYLVSSVGERMDRFGKHTGASRDERRGKFYYEDTEIDEKSDFYSLYT